jgi:hypothetical protein
MARIMCEVTRLGCTRDETAYHEAGHAAIELIHGFTPQLLIVKDRDGELSGECLSCAPADSHQAAWRGEKAVAGVLAQALYHAGRRLGLHRVLILTPSISELVDFFLTPPTAIAECLVSLSSEDGQQQCRVDLCSCYSEPDYLHFRSSVSILTEQFNPGHRFVGNEPECRTAAEQCVSHCVYLLNDRFVWEQLAGLAEALLATKPQTAHLLYRDGIESAAGLLRGYRPPQEPPQLSRPTPISFP